MSGLRVTLSKIFTEFDVMSVFKQAKKIVCSFHVEKNQNKYTFQIVMRSTFENLR